MKKKVSFDQKALMEKKNMNINKSNPLADHIKNIINIQKVLADENTQKLSRNHGT